MASRHPKGFTWVELILCLVVVVVLFSCILSVPGHNVRLTRGQMTQTLSNMKTLHLATQQMELDGITTENTNLSWPGDHGGSFSHWATSLVKGEYLSKEDLAKLLSAPGIIVPHDLIPTSNNTAVLVYAVSTNSPGNTVFLSSANFTNTPAGGLPLSPTAKPYGTKGFVIFHKAGDGAILLSNQVGNTNVIGSFAPLCH